MTLKPMPWRLVVLVAWIALFAVGLRYLPGGDRTGEVDAGERIAQALPKGALLRDYQLLPNITPVSYLVIYVEPGYQTAPVQTGEMPYFSCPEAVMGRTITGTYHLVLVRNGKAVSDKIIPVPTGFAGDTLGVSGTRGPLVYQNTKQNIYSYDFEAQIPDKYALETVKLLRLSEMTGDDQPYEFKLKQNLGGGCGFDNHLVAGFNPNSSTVEVYSDWVYQLNPDVTGRAYHVFDCGNHGNMTKVERWHRFNSQIQKFELTEQKSTPC